MFPPVAQSTASSPSTRDLLAAVPIVAEDVIATPTPGRPGLKLERALPPSGRFAAWLERHFGLGRMQSYELDVVGTGFFQAIDGRRTLAQIEALLRKENRFSESESRTAVIEFTKTLMLRGLVALRVPGTPTKSRRKGPDEHA